MNFVMFPLALAPIAETIVQHWDPPMVLVGKLLAIAVLVLLNGFFVAAEFALVKIRTSHLKTMAASGSKRAGLLRAIKENLNAYLSACQVGITMASLGLGWLGEPFLGANASAVFRFGRNRISRRDQIDFVRAGFFGDHVFAHRGGRTSTKDSGDPQSDAFCAVRECAAAMVLCNLQTGDRVSKRREQLGAPADSSRRTNCRRRTGT